MSLNERLRIYLIRAVVHFLVLLCWIGCGWIIVTVLDQTVKVSHTEQASRCENAELFIVCSVKLADMKTINFQ